jgi:hypothetical protein
MPEEVGDEKKIYSEGQDFREGGIFNLIHENVRYWGSEWEINICFLASDRQIRIDAEQKVRKASGCKRCSDPGKRGIY